MYVYTHATQGAIYLASCPHKKRIKGSIGSAMHPQNIVVTDECESHLRKGLREDGLSSGVCTSSDWQTHPPILDEGLGFFFPREEKT